MNTLDLFETHQQEDKTNIAPLADRMRPNSLSEVVGQPHLLGDKCLLASAIRNDQVPSLIFWGPPGSGKTTLARVLAHETKSPLRNTQCRA